MCASGRNGGTVIVNTRAVRPVTESLKPTGYDGAQMTEYLKRKCACLFVDGEAVCAPFGSAKFFNIILLGIAAGSGRLGLKRESVLHQMSLNLPERFLEINRQAFEAGFALGKKESL